MSEPDPLDECARRRAASSAGPHPHTPPIHLTSVWACESPSQADAILGGQQAGFVYARDGNPNASELAEICQKLHRAERAIVTSSGMSATAAAMLATLSTGDHVVMPRQLYGRTLRLFANDGARFGIATTVVDSPDVQTIAKAFTPKTEMVVVETIANPRLEVADIAALADVCHRAGALLLVDNTFAGPVIYRPLEHGADLVVESLTKFLNGHSDVILGLLVGNANVWANVPATVSTFGMSASAFDSWLARRGMVSYGVRLEQACRNAILVARWLTQQKAVRAVDFPGLEENPYHGLAVQQFGERFGTIVTFHLAGGRAAAEAFITAAKNVPFCPSLGEASTTVSHPETTSHRSMSATERASMGIDGGTMRLSVGIESFEFIRDALVQGLQAAGN